MGDGDAGASDTEADPVPIPRPRVLAATPAANASKHAASTKTAPSRTQRVTAKASMPSALPSVYTLSSSPQAERKAGPSAY
jgi:hypothetical protein